MVLLLSLMVVIALGFLAFLCALCVIIRFTMDMRQRAMFASVEAATELFHNGYGKYPPSDACEVTGATYCGAMKLTEAMIGQDLLGFHSQSVFRADGLDPSTLAPLYVASTAKAGRAPILPLEYANAYRLVDVFGKGNTGPFREDTLVMCDVFEKDRLSGRKTGMPILYYRANTSAILHDANDPDNPQNIYSYRDNQALLSLGVPGKPGQRHPLADPNRFYLNTRKTQVHGTSQPARADHILISAGRDGLYGTADDVCNFVLDYRER